MGIDKIPKRQKVSLHIRQISRVFLLGQLDTPSVETLRAPPIAPIDREANPPGVGNRRLTELKADGIIYIRGVMYTLLRDGCVASCFVSVQQLA